MAANAWLPSLMRRTWGTSSWGCTGGGGGRRRAAMAAGQGKKDTALYGSGAREEGHCPVWQRGKGRRTLPCMAIPSPHITCISDTSKRLIYCIREGTL